MNIDEDQENADWIKRTWDLPREPETFLAAIGGTQRLAHFMTLPAARNMPKSLRDALVPDEQSAVDSLKGKLE